jgi:uncharacterized UPF0160 family protein
VRTREEKEISAADYAVDVGFAYDPAAKRFDHHQQGGAGVRDNGIPYASFGLVWKEYGEQVCRSKEIAEEIDKMLVQPVDSYDNGIQFIESKIAGVYPYDLRMILYAFRPTWKEPDNVDDVFMQLVQYAKVLLTRQTVVLSDAIEAREKVEEAYHRADDKRIIVLDERYPWEEVLARFPEPLFVLYPKRGADTWSVKTIRNDFLTFNARKDLPESWAGKTNGELEAITGVPGATFCHKNRFLAVAKTKEAALKMAEIALNS